MTEREAIDRIQKIYEECECYGSTFETCDMCYNAVQIAETALEKQTPKKMIPVEGDLTRDFYTCPVCERLFDGMEYSYKYCPNCGQKLDWED